jgi:hypothetical protein
MNTPETNDKNGIKLSKEGDAIKQNEIDILEVTNIVTKIESSVDGYNSRMDKGKNQELEMKQRKSPKLKNRKKTDHKNKYGLSDLYDCNKRAYISLIGVTGEKEGVPQKGLEK